jgi:hypothetical protein
MTDAPASNEAIAVLGGAETIGRPLGSPAFLDSPASPGATLSRGNEGRSRSPISDLVNCHRNAVTPVTPP